MHHIGNMMPAADTAMLGVAVDHHHSLQAPQPPSSSGSTSPYLADDEEAATCLLLPTTPSPPPMDFIHPLLDEAVAVAGGDLNGPASLADADDDDDDGSAAIGNGDDDDDDDGNNATTANVEDDDEEEDARGETSSSSGSSGIGMDVPVIAGTTTLYNNKNVYQNLDNNGETFQQNGTKQYANLNIQITKDTPGFVHWNWPMIRQCSFVAFMAAVLTMAAVVVAMIVALPRTCDPKTTWYHGGVFYEIFPASYHDYNGDGVGDLVGLTTRIGYLNSLGIRAVRLNSIFRATHYPDDYTNVTTLLQIDPVLGEPSDLSVLADALHARNISLVLDLPIHPLYERLDEVDDDEIANFNETDVAVEADNGEAIAIASSLEAARTRRTSRNVESSDAAAPSKPTILEAMQLWLSYGVDGFYVQGMQHYADDPHLLANVRQWQRLLGPERVLIVSGQLLDAIAQNDNDVAEEHATTSDAVQPAPISPAASLRDAIIRNVDLVDVTIDLSGMTAVGNEQNVAAVAASPAAELATFLCNTVANNAPLAAGPGKAHVHWTLSANDQQQAQPLRRRLSSVAHSSDTTLAATLLSLMLPGTPNILYGDEIGLREAHDPLAQHADARHLHHLAPMAWSSERQFTGRQALPWMPKAPAGTEAFANREAIAELIRLRRRSPTLYQAAISRAGVDGVQQLNMAVRHSKDDVVIVERWYPRRQSFVSITNFGRKTVRLDLSSLFYGGVVVAGMDVGEKVLFGDFAIGMEQTVVVMLDK